MDDDSDDDDNLEHGDEDDDTRSPISYHCLIQCYIHPEMILFYEGHAILNPCGWNWRTVRKWGVGGTPFMDKFGQIVFDRFPKSREAFIYKS